MWKVYQRFVKSNGQSFPYQHDEITWYWLTPVGLWAKDQTQAKVYPDHIQARRDAKIYGGTAAKFELRATASPEA